MHHSDDHSITIRHSRVSYTAYLSIAASLVSATPSCKLHVLCTWVATAPQPRSSTASWLSEVFELQKDRFSTSCYLDVLLYSYS